jgi:anti-sigma regulatory factor (Ser/Thr protein kinase)
LEGGLVTGPIELSLPAEADLLFLVRLHVGAAASRIMTVEEIEDLQLAVMELCMSLLDPHGGADGRLSIVFTSDDESIEVVCTLTGPGRPLEDGRNDGLSEPWSTRILDALVDEHRTSIGEGSSLAWLRKKRAQVDRR